MAALKPSVSTDIQFNRRWIERIILDLADTFQIRIQWNRETAIITGTMAIAGGLVGGYAGGRVGAALGTGIGGAAGLGVAAFVDLRQIWGIIKEKVQELVYIVFNFLRRLDVADYERALHILMACAASRRELVLTILDFLTEKLGRQVISSITQQPH